MSGKQRDIFEEIAEATRPVAEQHNVGPSYFNTTNLEGKELDEERAKCKGQEGEVLSIFRWHHDMPMSPDSVHLKYGINFSKSVPLTSIRRAITTLTSKGLLRKTDQKVEGSYGKMTYTWELVK